MDNLSQGTIVLSLLSGVVGSVIGAVIGSWATLRATKISLDGLYKQEKNRRKFESNQRNLVVMHSLLKELKENESIANEVPNKAFKHVVMSREAWSIYKGSTSFMTKKLQTNLPYAYSLISEYNSLLEYDKAYLSHGAGYHNDKIAAAAEKFKGNVGGVIAQLEDLLKEAG
ncbi:hypothetical protein A3H83_00015 [Candidatus Roizmanbacteria bacterium RIFCSPLOWO2_02_FULL_39_8]|nr:MAG: hypothetical protein A3H83_00015 [Candidatus Roizmanbacteria bacterium RIFCSPLOWO2_02_FULL_39_8]